MDILICGSGGFIGKELSRFLREKGHVVNALHTKDFALEDADFNKRFEGKEVVINLCGHPILKSYTAEHKNLVYQSRVESLQRITDAICSVKSPPRLVISTSAIGIYRTGRVNIEDNPAFTDDFMGTLCTEWERVLLELPEGVRPVILRLGVVLGRSGGFIKRVLPSIRSGFGAYISPGSQWFSWIHIQDVLRIIDFAIENEKVEGAINAVAPKYIKHKQFMKMMASIVHRPLLFSVPQWFMRARYGEMSSVMTHGPKVFPRRLKDHGFEFSFSDPKQALLQILGKRK